MTCGSKNDLEKIRLLLKSPVEYLSIAVVKVRNQFERHFRDEAFIVGHHIER